MKKKKVIIFGLLDTAQLAKYYLINDSEYEVVGFTAHKKYIISNELEGLPVVPYENIQKIFPNNEFCFFIPMSGSRMNKLRESIYNEVKLMNYHVISYVSSKASIFTKEIGENCFILEDNTIQPFVKIGNNVTIWSGNHIGHHSIISDNVFITSHVVISGHCHIGANSFIGVNSAVRDGIQIGKGSYIAMSTSISNNTEPWSVYIGNPAVKKNMQSTSIRKL